jgi:hypothetical protein
MQATKILELQNDNLALKTENDRLLAAKKVLQNERKVWNEKYLNAKQEVTNLVGARSTETRKLEAAAATVRNLEKEAVAKGKELALVRKDLNKARTQLRETNSKAAGRSQETSYNPPHASSRRAGADELGATRSQLISIQKELNDLRNLHKEMGCEDSARHAVAAIAEANLLKEAAEADAEMYHHLGETHKLMEEQNTIMHDKLRVAIGDHVDNAERHIADQGKIAEVEKNIASVLAENQALRRKLAFAEENVEFFETQAARKAQESQEASDIVEKSRLRVVNVTDDASIASSPDHSHCPELSLSDITSVGTSPLIPQVVPEDDGVVVNVNINLDPADKKNYNLLKRVQIAISKKSQLDVQGPQDAVTKFVTAMDKAGANHEAMKALLTRYEIQIQQLQCRPPCAIANHRSFAEELEAKTFQLQALYSSVAEWQLRYQQLQSFRDTELRQREARAQRAARSAARER